MSPTKLVHGMVSGMLVMGEGLPWVKTKSGECRFAMGEGKTDSWNVSRQRRNQMLAQQQNLSSWDSSLAN